MNPVYKVFALIILIIHLSLSYTYSQEKPNYSEIQSDPGPGMAQIEGVIIEILPDSMSCGKTYDGIMVVEVDSILSKGRGFTQNLSVRQMLKLGYNNMLSKDFEFKTGQRFKSLLKETMCRDSISSPFIIISLQKS